MAIDTRDKRASCIGFQAPSWLILPTPDGAAEDQGDRQQASYSYRGILFTEQAVVGALFYVNARSSNFTATAQRETVIRARSSSFHVQATEAEPE